MRIALIDDDSTQISLLSEMILTELSSIGCPDYKIDAYPSGESFLGRERTEIYDVIILDIFMNGLSGIELARKIRQSDDTVHLIFCSASNEFASESYEVNADYYLRKPLTQENVSAMFRRLNLKRMELSQTMILPNGYSVRLRQILYTNYFNHVVTFYFKTEDSYSLRISQAELEDLLLPYGYFFSPIKGMIINLHEVVKLTKDSFPMSNGKMIHITRRKYKEARETYNRFCLKKL